jgi:hypothetical protein
MITAERRRFMAVLELKGGNKPSRSHLDKYHADPICPNQSTTPFRETMARRVSNVLLGGVGFFWGVV